MKRESTRRSFLRATSLTGLGLVLGTRGAPAILTAAGSPNEQLNIGIVGVAGRGGANLNGVQSQNIVALCDIDQKRLYGAAQRFKPAKVYNDFRKMLEQKDIDAVVVSTPDHTHAVASVAAMKAGKHVYCEKPLTHTVREAHIVASTSMEQRVATQMGTQIHAGENYRRVVELIRTGAIGAVTEAHAWVGKVWGGGDRPEKGEPLPPHIKYDLWLGPAPQRPYHSLYLPQNWRRWWDFGGGTLGDMGCHYLDLVHWALELENPVSVEASGPPVHTETAPAWLEVEYVHPARGRRPPVKVTWHDGGKRPKYFAADGRMPKWGDGVLFVGDGGMLLASYGAYRLLPEERFKDFTPPPRFIPPSVGHHQEWINSCKTGAPTTCNFRYAGALAETVLLGVVAYRSGKRVEWDRRKMTTGHVEADRFLEREYRQGWSL